MISHGSQSWITMSCLVFIKNAPSVAYVLVRESVLCTTFHTFKKHPGPCLDHCYAHPISRHKHDRSNWHNFRCKLAPSVNKGLQRWGRGGERIVCGVLWGWTRGQHRSLSLGVLEEVKGMGWEYGWIALVCQGWSECAIVIKRRPCV